MPSIDCGCRKGQTPTLNWMIRGYDVKENETPYEPFQYRDSPPPKHQRSCHNVTPLVTCVAFSRTHQKDNLGHRTAEEPKQAKTAPFRQSENPLRSPTWRP